MKSQMEQLRDMRKSLPKGTAVERLTLGKNEKVTLRVLPGKEDPETGEENLFVHQINVHWLTPGFRFPVGCLYHHGEGDDECPVCDKLEKLREREKALAQEEKNNQLSKAQKAANKAERNFIKTCFNRIGKRASFLMNVLVRDKKGDKVMLYAAPKTVFDGIADAIEENGVEILSPEKGHDVIIARDDTSRGTSYKVTLKLKPSPLAEEDDDIQDILERRYDLDKQVEVKDADEMTVALKEALDGIKKEIKRKDAQTKLGPKASRALADDDDDEEEEDDEEEDDDDTEFKSKSKSNAKKSRKPPVDEDEEDDDDDDDDDEDDNLPGLEDDDEDDEEEDDDDEDDDDEDDNLPGLEDDDEDDEEEDDAPAKKPKVKDRLLGDLASAGKGKAKSKKSD